MLLCNFIFAQTAVLKGKVLDDEGLPFPGATVKIGSKTGTVTNADGLFELAKIPVGKHIVTVYALGMEEQKHEVNLKANEVRVLNIRFKASNKDLGTVSIEGKSNLQQVKEQPYHVTAINAKALHNTSQDINQVLNKSAGIRIREEGGLGSSFNFSMNGFSGKQVRFFLDGVPMDNFGSALSLNNIPINLAERIEIYKGVVPIWLGADALGGAVNIVSNGKARDFLDVSYSYGSFNTHRLAVSGAYTNKKNGLTISTNIFKNHSDNNYWVDVPITNLYTNQVPNTTEHVRRFHDQYSSESVQLEGGVIGKKYADRMLVGIILAKNYKEIQTGAQMSTVFGSWHQNSNTIMPTFKYQKRDFLIKGLSFNAFGSINLGATQNVDTVARTYNWAGESRLKAPDSVSYIAGGESSWSLYKFKNNTATATSNLSYRIAPGHTIGMNYVFSNFNRTGFDPLFPRDSTNLLPQVLRKQIVGIGYNFDFRDRLSVSVFAKYYHNQAEAWARGPYSDPSWKQNKNSIDTTGYGIAAAYFIFKDLQIKGSYELACRMPDGEELFGDGVNQIANKSLKPENSNNYNIGFVYSPVISTDHRIILEANFLARKAADFIRVDVSGEQRTQSVNVRGVKNSGFDAYVKYIWKDRFNIGANITYQTLYNSTQFEPNQFGTQILSAVYLDRIPNIPYLFGNVDLGLRISPNHSGWGNLSTNYNFSYVEEFYLKWPSLGDPSTKSVIPLQLSHDLSISYSTIGGRYNLTLDCKNLTNAKLYDNFALQKAGRAFYFKVRYFLSNK
ncbi:MAG: TonB-dependent receptor [Bacteroidota bacterium]